MEILRARKEFSQEDYDKNDSPGKIKAMKILSKHKPFLSGKYIILKPIEDKQCGDIKTESTVDKSIIVYEIENSGLNTDRFEKNFKGKYSTVNVPMKNLISIPDGFFMAVDANESEFTDIPKRFYIVKVKYVLSSPIAANVNKKSNGKLENFYKVPSHLVRRYEWNDEKGMYVRFNP